jgi:hypothetical protein
MGSAGGELGHSLAAMASDRFAVFSNRLPGGGCARSSGLNGFLPPASDQGRCRDRNSTGSPMVEKGIKEHSPNRSSPTKMR